MEQCAIGRIVPSYLPAETLLRLSRRNLRSGAVIAGSGLYSKFYYSTKNCGKV